MGLKWTVVSTAHLFMFVLFMTYYDTANLRQIVAATKIMTNEIGTTSVASFSPQKKSSG